MDKFSKLKWSSNYNTMDNGSELEVNSKLWEKERVNGDYPTIDEFINNCISLVFQWLRLQIVVSKVKFLIFNQLFEFDNSFMVTLRSKVLVNLGDIW